MQHIEMRVNNRSPPHCGCLVLSLNHEHCYVSVQAVRPSLREGKQSMAAKHRMLGQRWKEMTLQWKNPWYVPC